MRLAVVGADGKMGRELLAAIKRIDGAELAGAVVKSDSPYVGKDAGLLIGQAPCGIILSDDPLPVFAKVEGVLDFTSPEASVAYAAYAAQARIVHVIGTTGFSNDDEDKIKAAAAHATIVKSGNMSLGVNVLASLVRKAAKALNEEYDIEIAEMHHRRKVDAPSGTALLLGQAAAQARRENLAEVSVRGRDGHTGPRKTGTIGFSSLRGGTVVGDHSVIFAGENERIVLSHFAQERSIFADGAVKAALWAQNRKHGLYSMADVLGLTD
ncbi:4-hydroxy-tetrahydrodipicolinate reductase [uncultured Bartonella sp.]|uniref:4-hydroxy-tetrahydrodipicolinate reductase n=1 Tax=uncultured Bartonella sp. TaxID=104108 RepID=UPI00262B92BC|nr:4-hydroxy-tetrahydrodipicolinate reductase [uncultured Bartonella sp.]